MEKQKINFSFQKFVSHFKLRADMTESSNILWRAALWFFLLGCIAVIGVGYFTYQWAVSAGEVHALPKPDKSTLSQSELESIITLYQKKQANFSSLLFAAPQPPMYQRGIGSPVPQSAIPESSETVQPEVTSPSAGGPQG